MTTDVKLLPLPEKHNDVAVDGEGNETFFEFFTDEQMEAYARANMEPLIAENERLAKALRGGVTMLERLHGELGPCEAGDSVWDVRGSLKGALARAALDQEGGK